MPLAFLTLPRATHCHPAWTFIAGLFGLTAVALGAIASHALSDPHATLAVERAATYQLIHAVVLLYTTFLSGKLALIARSLLVLGIALFCGSIELKYLAAIPAASAFAPGGGVALMLAWLMLAVSGLVRSTQKN